MKFEDFSLLYNEKIWFCEFLLHWQRIDEETLEKISEKINESNRFQTIDGLYQFFRFLFNFIDKEWEGFLSPELVYLTTKALVLMGLNFEAQKISRGYSFHPGCCAWRLGSFYRNDSSDSKEVSDLYKQAQSYLVQEEDQLIQVDLISWMGAYKEYNEIEKFFFEKRFFYKNILSFVLLIDRCIYYSDINKANLFMNETKNYIPSKIEEIMLINKKAVLSQLRGDQKQALTFFEEAQEKASIIGDFLTSAKVSYNQASSYLFIDEYELSIQSYQKAENLYKIINDPTGIGKCYNGLSSVYTALGEYTIAEKYISLCKQIFTSTKNRVMLNGVLYKNAYLMYIKGEYQSALQIIQMFDPNEQSILNFQIGVLKITAMFESDRSFNETNIEILYEMAEKLTYRMGKALLNLEVARIYALLGNLAEAVPKLNSAYTIYQEIGNYRGIIRSLLINSFIELLKGNINEAEQYCVTGLEQAKNNSLFMEEVEANILLANIVFLKNFPKRALNLLENSIYALEVRNLRNHHYLQAMYSKCNLGKFVQPSFGILNNDLINFIKNAKNSGSLYWVDQSRLLEAEEYLRGNNNQNAQSIVLELLEKSTNSEIKFQARKIFIKVLLKSLKNSNLIKTYSGEQKKNLIRIQEELLILEKNAEKKSAMIQMVETKILKIEFLQITDQKDQLMNELQILSEKISYCNLKYYNKEIDEICELIPENSVKINLNCLLSI